MKFMKYLFAFTLALAFCATASVSHAQGVPVYVASGSSALFLELGQAAAAIPDAGCYWTLKSNSAVSANDPRTTPATVENGNIWVAWNPGTGTCAAPAGSFDVYSEMSLDSVLGDRCFFAVDSTDTGGCIQVITVTAGNAGQSPSLLGAGYTDTPIPANVISALNNARMNVAATDIRPEDAKFASFRMFTTCGTGIYREPYIQTSYTANGLGYQTSTTGVGTPVQSFTNPGVEFHVLDFNISGNDPISGQSLSGAGRTGYVVTTVGAQPIVVVVSPAPAGGTGLSAANDITGLTLALFLNGSLGRSTDLQGPSSTNPVITLVREPLSGTYNTMEYSIPGSAQFKTSQDNLNCSGAVFKENPLDLPSANGKIAGAARERTIGTSEMVAALQAASTDTLGYFFWSAGNAANFTATNGKYLTVNGVDPLLPSYSSNPVAPGVLPTGTNLSAVTFANLNAGDYPIWSPLRLVSTSTASTFVNTVVSAAQTLNSTKADFIPLSQLKIWHSHFNIFAVGVTDNGDGPTINPATPGDLCSVSGVVAEGGGDAGGANLYKQANADFCSDFNVPIGIDDKNN